MPDASDPKTAALLTDDGLAAGENNGAAAGRTPPAFSADGRGRPSGVSAPPRNLRGRLAEAAYFLRYLRPVRWLLVLIVAASLLADLLRLPVMFIPQQLTQHFSDKPYLWMYLSLAMGAMIVSGLLSLLQGYCSNRMGEYLARAIRLGVFSRLEQLSMLSVMARGAGQFVQRIVRDVEQIRDLFRLTLTQLITQTIQVSVLVAAMLWLEPLLTVILVSVFLLVGVFIRRINQRVEFLARRIQQLSEQSIDQMVESVSGFRDIQASGRFDRFYGRFEDVVRDTERTCVRAGLWAHIAGTLPTVAMGVLLVVPYYLAVQRYESPQEIGQIITYVMLLGQAMPVFTMMTRSTSLLARATPALRQVRLILEPPEKPAPPFAAPSRPAEDISLPIRSIRFENVGLELGGRRILHDLSFEIPGEKFTAIVGQSGAGKTTLFMLLLRLLKPTEGNIRINDTPLPQVPLKQLRRLLGFIPQNPFIFNQTLRENLLVAAEEDQDAATLARAIEIAQLNELVHDREGEGGLEAVAGHMGARLSGGEKQRIALGRLVIQDPQIIVCDEYTANIDVKTARVIHEAINTHFRQRTRVVITHELYTVKGADHIVVLDDGRVAQQGVHEELVRHPGLYRELWQVQTLQ